MKRYCIEVELVTPCISSGVDQSVAEFRAPSIRGELRSWFRWLGGSRDEEQAVFGGVHGEAPSASQVIVRVRSTSFTKGKATST